MKVSLQILFSAVVLSAIVAMSGCKGKTGDPGPAGKDGTNGTNGTNGSNGVGFEAATKLGNIILYLDGTTPAGDPFKDTLDFKFAVGDLSKSSADPSNPNQMNFYVQRYLTFDSETIPDDNANLYFQPYVDIETGDTTYYMTLDLHANVATTDYRYFTFTENLYNTDGSNFTNESYKGFKYDPNKGKLYFRFSLTVPAIQSSTGYDVNVDGVVNVIVYQPD